MVGNIGEMSVELHVWISGVYNNNYAEHNFILSVYIIVYPTLIPAMELFHSFMTCVMYVTCNQFLSHTEQKQNRQLTRQFFPSLCRKSLRNETTSMLARGRNN